MKHTAVYKKIISVLVFIGLVLQLSSCYKTTYRFIHESDEIISIEIVENRYTYEDSVRNDYQNVLVSIQDIDSFLNKFSAITYTMPLYNGLVTSFRNSEIGIKFKFNNGDYEILSSGVYSLIYENTNGYDRAIDGIIGFFDEEQFDALMMEYLCESKSANFYLMGEMIDISSIEIVDAYMLESSEGIFELAFDIVAEVENRETLLSELHSVDYSYTLQKPKNEAIFEQSEHRKAIKITYSNGDYEIFGSDWRRNYISHTNECIDNAYIGEFDREQFDALIVKYCK